MRARQLILSSFFGGFLFIIMASVQSSALTFTPEVEKRSPDERALRAAFSVCLPFFLRDESGAIIDPVHGKNENEPYSPRATCGACHDYERITSAFHFQQGRGEDAQKWQKDRYQWVSSPGQYGGRW